MGHNHSHGHSHDLSHNVDYSRIFGLGILLNVAFILVEVFYGMVANSSALLADAGHNVSDVLGLVFAWLAVWLASKKPKGKFSFGFKKSTILISVLNAMLLFVACGFILWDAIGRLANPEPVAGTQVIIVAGIGVVINTITALLFLKGQKDDLNIRGAFLHMAADAAVSLGVVVAGLLINKTGYYWIDPIMSFIIVGIIIIGTWQLFRDSLNLALDASPASIDLEKVETLLLAIDGVEGTHELHAWALSTTENSISVHIETSHSHPYKLLEVIQNALRVNFQVNHCTIQIEKSSSVLDCKRC